MSTTAPISEIAASEPGTTSEFWLTLSTNVLAVVVSAGVLIGHPIDSAPWEALLPSISLIAASLTTAVYAHTRGVVKAATVSARGVASAAYAPAAPTFPTTAQSPNGASPDRNPIVGRAPFSSYPVAIPRGL
jgi:hypothetical protein